MPVSVDRNSAGSAAAVLGRSRLSAKTPAQLSQPMMPRPEVAATCLVEQTPRQLESAGVPQVAAFQVGQHPGDGSCVQSVSQAESWARICSGLGGLITRHPRFFAQAVRMSPLPPCGGEMTNTRARAGCSVSSHPASASSSAAAAGCQSGIGAIRSSCASGTVRNSSSVLRGGVCGEAGLGRRRCHKALNPVLTVCSTLAVGTR